MLKLQLTKKKRERYLNDPRKHCPFCGYEDTIIQVGEKQSKKQLKLEYQCNFCGYGFYEIYKLYTIVRK